MIMTKVFNLSTNEELTFSLPPAEAVIAAYEQANGNYTLDYPTPEDAPGMFWGRLTVSCGDWCAFR